jgi:hypothetical protein
MAWQNVAKTMQFLRQQKCAFQVAVFQSMGSWQKTVDKVVILTYILLYKSQDLEILLYSEVVNDKK